MLQEHAQEPDDPVAYRFAFLNPKYPQNTPHDLIVELFLVIILLHFVSALLPTFLVCFRRLKTACLLNLP